VGAKEPNLDRFLRYDRSPRHSFRLLLFDPARTHDEYGSLQLGEAPGFASGVFQPRNSSFGSAELSMECPLPEFATDLAKPPCLLAIKQFSFGPSPQGCEISCDISLSLSEPLPRNMCVGVESIINFLAPADSDRFFDTPDGPRNLRFSGSLPGPLLRMEDGWQRIRLTLHAPSVAEYWVAPIETVSESEGGFERVYQGSQILALWRPNLTTQTTFTARLLCRLETM
jgi:4-alpha-glucanotransferase